MSKPEDLEKRARRLADLTRERDRTPVCILYKEDLKSEETFLAFGLFRQEYGKAYDYLNFTFDSFINKLIYLRLN